MSFVSSVDFIRWQIKTHGAVKQDCNVRSLDFACHNSCFGKQKQIDFKCILIYFDSQFHINISYLGIKLVVQEKGKEALDEPKKKCERIFLAHSFNVWRTCPVETATPGR